MGSSIYLLGFVSIVVFLAAHESVAKHLHQQPYSGFRKEMPAKCFNQSYCLEKHPVKVQNIIDNLLSELNLTLGSVHEEPKNKGGQNNELKTDCKSTVTFDLIYNIVDENGDIRDVVQSSKKIFQQQIRIESCDFTGRLTKGVNFNENELKVYDISCHQESTHYNFVVLNKTGNGLESVRSKYGIPSCCSPRYNGLL